MTYGAASAKTDEHVAARERALALAANEVAGELRMTDLVDLIAFIRTDNHPNIGDLVNSSAELYFREGTLRYGWAADVEMSWIGAPSIRLDLEFRHHEVTAFFRLLLQPREAGVELLSISFENPLPDPAQNTQRLIAAIEGARLPALACAAA